MILIWMFFMGRILFCPGPFWSREKVVITQHREGIREAKRERHQVHEKTSRGFTPRPFSRIVLSPEKENILLRNAHRTKLTDVVDHSG